VTESNTGTLHERTDASDHAIAEAEIRCPFESPIENQQLLLEEDGFGDPRTSAAGTSKTGDCRQQMEEDEGQVAHPTILPRPQRVVVLMI